ncbi:hypothetical protein V6257_07465 [Pseudoalteromonas issachenkonii]|uniref:Four helix bundle protein n=1 Tax=Pseudoalteromonas issachenkonii TaxID=152297 RepID=A0ABU9GZ45_9GAMM
MYITLKIGEVDTKASETWIEESRQLSKMISALMKNI